MDLRKDVFALLALFAFICMAIAEDTDDNSTYNNPTSIEEKNLIFNLDQNVRGTGFFSIYKYTSMPDALGTEGLLFNGVEGKNKAHGSGKIDKDSKMHAESSYTNKSWLGGALDEDGEVILDKEETTSIIQMKEDGSETYIPIVMDIGSLYYELHPIVFDSLLKEEEWIKNRNSLNSLYHRADNAHGLNMTIDTQADTQSDVANNMMSVDEGLLNGQAHFKAVQLANIPVDSDDVSVLGQAMKTWKNPDVNIDEDYWGTLHITKNMTFYTHSEEKEKEEDWLLCCSNGWYDMNAYDQKSFGKRANGIFDCTCFEVPSHA